MSDPELRLRLFIRRNGLPEVKLVWTVPCDPDFTVAKLLSQVNDVVPLESGEWGLEDYAVELKGVDGIAFECLHFQQVSKVLKNDDQVVYVELSEEEQKSNSDFRRGLLTSQTRIRALLTDDIKRRRLSGRHQISSDGKHLVDGVAFGRPWLRAPRDRPGVSLPPRKRARITYEDEDEDEYVNLDEDPFQNDGDSPLLLEYFDNDMEDYLESQKDQAPPLTPGNQPKSVSFAATFDDADAVDPRDSDDEKADEDEDDPDFDPARENAEEEEEEDVDRAASDGAIDEDSDLSLELQDIRKDQSSHRQKGQEKRLGGFIGSYECDSEVQAQAKVLQTAFPDAPIGLCEQLIHDGNDLLESYHQVFQVFHPVLFPEEMLQHGRNCLKQLKGPDGKEGKTGRTKNPQPASGLKTSSSESLIAHSAKKVPRSSNKGKAPASSSSSSSSSRSVSSDSSSDSSESPPAEESVSISESSSDASVSSSGSGDPDVSDGDGTVIKHVQSVPKSVTAECDDGSSSGSSSSSSTSSDDSSSDSEPEEATSKRQASQSQSRLAAGLQLQPPTATHSSQGDQQPVPPGQGLRKTQRRNLRRKLAKRKTTEPRDESSQADHLAPPSAVTPSSYQDDDLLARKKALLDLMETDFPEDSQKQLEMQKSSSALTNPDEQVAVLGASIGSPERRTTESLPSTPQDNARPASQEPPDVAEPEKQGLDNDSTTASEQRRMKLNLGAGRRMLFGALGLRNPKTKADEDKLRTDLMKNVRPHTNPRAAEAESAQPRIAEEPEAVAGDEDPGAWREKINYRAVECCEENVDLSEPPFPFVQRWDPQQQAEAWFGTKKSGGKRKRAQRNAAQYYQDEEENPQTSKKQRFADENCGLEASRAPEDDSNLDDTVLVYDDPPPKPTTADSQFSDMDDLPSVPSDLSVLPIMGTGEAKPGMVITWKQLLLSTATNWQPQLVNLTAIVVNIEGTRLRLLLAKRDRELDRNEKVYDETTGKRIYDRFEAPDMDEDEDEEETLDDGYRDLDFSELMEPRVLQQPLRSYGPGLAFQDSEMSAHSVVHETPLATQRRAGVDSETVHQAGSQTGKPSKAHWQDSDETMDIIGGSSRQPTDSASAAANAAAETERQRRSSILENEEISGVSQQQLEGMSEPLEASEEHYSAEPTPTPLGTNDGDLPSLEGDQLDETQHGGNVAESIEAPSQGLQPTMDSSVRSGRQPDPDFSIDLGQGSPIPMEGQEDSGALYESTPKAGNPVETPKKSRPVDEPPSGSSLPSINEIWATAATSRSAREPSSAALEAAFQSQLTSVGPDPAYEEAMRRLDDGSDMDDEAFTDTTKKQLFPNATQPATKLSASSPADNKPDLSTVKSEERKTSGFSIPVGSQVVALSSDSSSSAGEERFEENYAYDNVDGDYEDLASPSHGGEQTQRKTTRQNANGKEKGTDKTKPNFKAKGKTKTLAESLPAKNRVKGGVRRASMPASSQLGKGKGKKSGRRARRVTSMNGEI